MPGFYGFALADLALILRLTAHFTVCNSPQPKKRAAAWAGLPLATALLLWLLGPVLTPFVVAAVLAYALTPLVDRLDALARRRVPRVVAVVVVELVFVLVLLCVLLLIVPILAKEMPLLREQVPLLVAS